MNARPDLSLCLVAERDCSLLRPPIAAIYRHAGPVAVEVIVVVSSAAGEKAAALAAEFKELIIYENFGSEPKVRARNRALQLATGRYLSFWDDDVSVCPGCLPQLVTAMDEVPEIGIMAPTFSSADSTELPGPESFAILLPFLRRRLGRHAPAEAAGRIPTARIGPAGDMAVVLGWLPPIGQVLRQEVLEEIGLPDDRFGCDFSALEYCRRARRRGWRLAAHAEAKAVVLTTGRRRSAGPEGSWGELLRYLCNLR